MEKINLNWLRNLLLGVFSTWVVSFALQFVCPTIDTGSYIWLLVAIQIYLMGYFGLRHPEIFVGWKTAGRSNLRKTVNRDIDVFGKRWQGNIAI